MAIVKKKATPEAKPKTTRAKKVVEVVAPPPYISPFVAGNRVTHASFGNGKVAEVTDDKLSIVFDDQKTRVIVDSFVKAQKS